MNKFRNMIFWSCLFILPELLAIIFTATCVSAGHAFYTLVGISAALLIIWLSGCIFILFNKKSCNVKRNKFLMIAAIISISIVSSLFALSLITSNYPYTGNFSIQTPVFKNKSVMVIVPHQDDDINLVGGLIEPYIENNSEVTVVFTTNGDFEWSPEARAQEVVAALTPLGIKKENIYYLGFGDQWKHQTGEHGVLEHIYTSPDPDTLWTSHCGRTETYGTAVIDCYLKLPYTKNNFLYSIKSLILDKKPEVIFAVDFDHHLDHKGTSLLFEETMGQILKEYPDYHPTVYKGFCYGTAWTAPNDYYDDINLLSSKKPDKKTWNQTSFTYRWEDRLRFPIGISNLNNILSNNSVFTSLKAYRTAEACQSAPNVLNGDKVFWERRTDSLLYDAEIQLEGHRTDLLNDFQLIDFKLLTWAQDIFEDSGFCGAVECGQNQTVRIQLRDTITANSLYLYDHPDLESNILGGYIAFSDGSSTEFADLEKDGRVTKIAFPSKEIDWLEITVTKSEGKFPGLTEIELYYDTQTETETFLMAVDQDDNFVYDYILQNEDSVVLEIRQFPDGQLLDCDNMKMSFDATGNESHCTWENSRLHVYCDKNETCTITVSKDGASTTFTVSNPYTVKVHLIELLRKVDETSIHSEALVKTVTQIFVNKFKNIINK